MSRIELLIQVQRLTLENEIMKVVLRNWEKQLKRLNEEKAANF